MKPLSSGKTTLGRAAEPHRGSSAPVREKAAKLLFFACALISVIAVLLICVFLFAMGIPGIAEIGVIKFLTGLVWRPSSGIYGIFPMIIGSLFSTAGALIIGVPVGIFCAVFLAFYCPARLYRPTKAAVTLLAGIPSVIYGFFGLTVIVPLVRNLFGGSGSSLLSASVVLGIMILPTVVSVSESSMKAVPQHYSEGALALGATKERSLFKAVIPAASSGITASVVLGIGRAVGETMAVIMVAGNQPIIPLNLITGFRTMTANIVMEMGYAADLHLDALIGTGVVLFVFVLIINIMFSLLKGRSVK